MVEARHGTVFHLLCFRPWEKWVKLGGSLGLVSASTLNPLAWLLHMSFGGGGIGKEILPYQLCVQVRGPLEESSVDCLEEGCNGRVAEALVCKFNIVGLIGLCVGEARSFNDGVAKVMTFTGAGLCQGCFNLVASDITDGCSGIIAWNIGASACSTWWLSMMCALLGLIKTSTGVVFAILSGLSGRVLNLVVGSLYPS
jgi:hypothetical protein